MHTADLRGRWRDRVCPYLTCEAGDEADESSIERRVLAALGGIASAALARSGDLNPEMLSGIRRARTFFEGMP